MKIAIERVSVGNFDEVLPLVAAYQQFYGAEPREERNRAHFGTLIRDDRNGVMLMGRDVHGKPVGFVTVYFQLSSLSAGRVSVLNDLYVLPECRGLGVAVELMKAAKVLVDKLGFRSLEGMTQANNKNAQKLYERLEAQPSEWIYYTHKW